MNEYILIICEKCQEKEIIHNKSQLKESDLICAKCRMGVKK